ncbi:MAG: CotH kinase family protein [Pseudomonadota bacterium]
MKKRNIKWLPILALTTSTLSCRPKMVDPSDLASKNGSLFDPSSIATISFSMSGDDLQKMKQEGRDISEKINECRSDVDVDPYQKYKVSGLSVNGSNLGGATLTKKGYMGSLSAAKPSFKLKDVSKDINEIVLNSDRQDPSHIKQCLAYFFFDKAGLPTPKCQLAEVSIQAGGHTQNLGLYTMVESPKTAYETIDGKSGILVEGTHADFSDSGRNRFEIKTKDSGNDKTKINSLISQVTTILKSPPSSAGYDQLANLVDLESFYKYWATEALIGHWDGYANNMNNFMFFVPTKDGGLGKIKFLPWGTDGTFVKTDIINRGIKNRLYHVSASAALPNWLIKYEPSRKQYIAVLKELLSKTWGPGAVEEFQKLKALSMTSTISRDSEYGNVMKRVQDYLDTQKRVLESELTTASSSSYSSLEKGTISCWAPIAEISGVIDAMRADSPFSFHSEIGSSSLNLSLITEDGKTSAPISLLGTSLAMRQVLENRDISLSTQFKTSAIPNVRFAFSTITEKDLFNTLNVPMGHLGYANTGALQVQVDPSAGDAGWMELGLIGGGSLTILDGIVEPKGGTYALPEKSKVSFTGKIYSKYPLSILLKKLGK